MEPVAWAAAGIVVVISVVTILRLMDWMAARHH